MNISVKWVWNKTWICMNHLNESDYFGEKVFKYFIIGHFVQLIIFLLCFSVSKMSEKYHLHKVNEDFSDIFWSIQKDQQKSDSIKNMPANEYFMQNHTFLMYWGRKGPKTRQKKLKTKGTPFWFLPFLLVFRICL